MSRILVCYFSERGEAMYDAICDTLLDNGNIILRFNINNSSVNLGQWGGQCTIKDSRVIQKICNFDPDLILNFNNSLPIGIEDKLRDDCVICVLDADSPESFWNKDHLRENFDRYVYLGLQSYSEEMYRTFFNKQLENGKNYLYFPAGTVIRSEKLPQNKNISFIGTNFHLMSTPNLPEYYSDEALEIYDSIHENYFYDMERIKSEHPQMKNLTETVDAIKVSIAGQERLKCLQAICDLGLTIYGVRWEYSAYYDFELAKCFDKTPITTIEDNQWVYNTSKISINISHPQAKSSFSWRVMDIMASQACLLTEDKKDFRELFGKYLSEDVLDAVIYDGPHELRKKAYALLNDENLRNKCVRELNNAIDKNGRWEYRFKSLQEMSGIQLLNNDCTPTYETIVNETQSTSSTSADNLEKCDLTEKSAIRKMGRKGLDFLQKVLLKIEKGQ